MNFPSLHIIKTYFIISEAHTIIDPGAMMVHLKRTNFTD